MIVNILIAVAVIAIALFFLGLCVFVHELGHFFVALWRGLYIERFSIGFGRKLWGFRKGNVEFVVSMLPLGGYVALPQLEPTDEPHDEQGNALPPARPLDRILTAVAGPLSNVAFGFLLATVLWAVKLERPMSMNEYKVAAVKQEMEAGEITPEYAAGLRPGDTIVKVNGEDVPENPQRFMEEIIYPPAQITLTIQRDGQSKNISYKKAPNPDFEGLPYPYFDVRVPVVADLVSPGLPADKAGIEPGDQFLAVDGNPVDNPGGFVASVRASQGEPIDIKVLRNGKTMTFSDITPIARESEGQTIHIIGVAPGVPERLVRVSPWQQFVDVMSRTRDTLQALFTPKSGISARHMSGPVGIMAIHYQMIRYQGWRQGLAFVVLVTFNLALLNMLPIPVLDGGHLVFGVIEGITGRRIPPRGARIIQSVFAVLLISLILYITLFDVNRFIKPLLPGGDEDQQEEAGEQPGENADAGTGQNQTENKD